VERQGVLHASASDPRHQETLKDIDPSLPAVAQPTLFQLVEAPQIDGRPPAHWKKAGTFQAANVHLSQRNTPALFGAGLLDAIPDRIIIAGQRKQHLRWGFASPDVTDRPVGRVSRLEDGRVGRFGWKGQIANLTDFVRAACANELGLGNPGQAQPVPLGKADYKTRGLDLTDEQCNQLTAFVASLPRPEERLLPSSEVRERAHAGKALFHKIGCADCHTPDLGSVSGVYSDLLLHRMGQDLEGTGSYDQPRHTRPRPSPGEKEHADEWRTPPLWGVADSAPYQHDGRAATLEEAILLHGGQGERSAQRFRGLSPNERTHLILFLKTLKAP
jgi:CxxC motif-containing protein (DUF1111 family)